MPIVRECRWPHGLASVVAAFDPCQVFVGEVGERDPHRGEVGASGQVCPHLRDVLPRIGQRVVCGRDLPSPFTGSGHVESHPVARRSRLRGHEPDRLTLARLCHSCLDYWGVVARPEVEAMVADLCAGRW